MMEQSKILYEKGIIQTKPMLTPSEYQDIQFVAKLENIKSFYNSLKAINIHEDVTIEISDRGFKAICEVSKYAQATVYISKECFSEYQFQATDDISMRLNFNVLCDCLSCFTTTSSSTLKIYHKGPGAPLVLLLEQHEIDDLITECAIKTKTSVDTLEFTIDKTDSSYNFILIRGSDFGNLFNEINRTADELEILLSPTEPHFQLTVLGVIQSESNIRVAKTSEMMIKFLCQKRTRARYRMSHIRLMLKALNLASKVAVTTDSSGLLGIQTMVLSSQSAPPIYIEFYILPLID